MQQEEQLSGAAALAKGLESLLAPVAEACDQRVEKVVASQLALSQNIDRLTRVLVKLQESSPDALVEEHTAKLLGVRGRVTAMATTLQGVQARLVRLHAMKSQLPKCVRKEVIPVVEEQTSTDESVDTSTSQQHV
eukprot:CAMPEP_0196573466 /NCGR_PEP_ID=MMETSP1081-20130531/3370_1 /TAXON_ID=36882 /ORGANISM="Pyramimonas amylifera, Strain CCMP720" /LENGTH=134 /DNA_ID=CAMNT_0041891193 /DNA_START=235 /DNA_END=639 /DNA_ORIENTATION=+